MNSSFFFYFSLHMHQFSRRGNCIQAFHFSAKLTRLDFCLNLQILLCSTNVWDRDCWAGSLQWDSLQTPAAMGPTVLYQGNEQVNGKSINSVSPLFPRAVFPLILSSQSDRVSVNMRQPLWASTLPSDPSRGSVRNQGVDVALGDTVSWWAQQCWDDGWTWSS